MKRTLAWHVRQEDLHRSISQIYFNTQRLNLSHKRERQLCANTEKGEKLAPRKNRHTIAHKGTETVKEIPHSVACAVKAANEELLGTKSCLADNIDAGHIAGAADVES